MGHAPTKSTTILTRAAYARALFFEGKIDVAEFERRIGLLIMSGKESDPYIIDAGPVGFKDPS